MILPDHDLPISKQAKVLGISRSSVFYQPRPLSDRDLAPMKRIDWRHLELPFTGAKMLRGLLSQEGFEVGRRLWAPLCGKWTLRRRLRQFRFERLTNSKPRLCRGILTSVSTSQEVVNSNLDFNFEQIMHTESFTKGY